MGRDTGEKRSQSPSKSPVNLSRRRVLETGAALGAASTFAGCLGDDGDGGDDGTGDDSMDDDSDQPDRYDRTLRSSFPGGENIEAYHFNPFRGPNSALQGHFLGGPMYDSLFITDLRVEQVEGVLANDWGIDGDEAWIEISDEYTWHDGTELTIDDVEIVFEINHMEREHFDNEHQLWSDWETEGDYTIRFDLVDTWNEAYFFGEIDPLPVSAAYPDYFAEWRDDLADAGPGSDEFEDLLNELSEDTDAPEIGFGPFALDERTSNVAEFSLHEGHPAADEINFTGYSKESVADPELAFIEGNIDYSGSIRYPLEDDLQDQLDEDNLQPFRGNYNRSQQMMMNVGFDPDTGERRDEWHPTYERVIRQSIAHTVDNHLAAESTGDNWEPYRWPSSSLPIAGLENDEYDLGAWTDYSEHNEDRAIELINQSERYYYEDGTVLSEENDEQAHLELMTISGRNEFMGPSQVAVSNLEELGWDVTFATVDDATYDDRRRAGDFDVYFDGQRFTRELGGPGLYFWWQETAGFPDTLEVPMPVGDPDGDLGEVDLIGNLQSYNNTQDEETRREIRIEMNWALNQYVAQAITTYIWSPGVIRNDHFELANCDQWLEDNFGALTFAKIPGKVCLQATN